MNRMLAFLLVVVVSVGVVAATSTELVKQIKLGLDLKGGFEILYQAEPITPGGVITQDALRETAKSLEARVNANGVEEPEITPEGNDRIRARIAGVTDQEDLRNILKKPQELTFRSARGCAEDAGYCKVELTGIDFVEGGANTQQSTLGSWEITIELKSATQFAEITREVAKLGRNQLAIYLDETELSAPNVSYEINSKEAVISGNYTREEAKKLKDTINLGALPLKLTEKYTQSVGASLGQLSLQQTLFAGGLGTVLVLLFMMIYYRIPGIIASISLIVFIWMLLLGFYLINATLTLPGIAAFILAIGMAVDANIITYERIREEMRSGKSVLSSLRAGSKNSFRTIMDANITTIIAGLVLFFIGTGSVKGFAVILILSIIISVITNVAYSRLLLYMLIRSNKFNKPAYFGVKESEIREL
ncbi:Protein translocase subunit SecDF [Paenibacillus plantiphilus]|uniref:Protein translocase subunit SecD n=1 Tax=Paenibacillus plantiphilus TaxID=2905650 RepID=A0ABM9C7E4_9BACL|nr:protein translocase subunit SecD [Paenibacillus plantiphilus]CAH1204308.1 Protein translocase subunit SecDF [Paenibacillus plantiphilus]